MSDTLWAVHVEGPDDILAMPDRATADAKADEINAVAQMLRERPTANLLDSPRYMAWHKGTQETPFPAILTTRRQHQEIARYLEATKETPDAP